MRSIGDLDTDLLGAVDRAMARGLKEIERLAVERSSGPYSSRWLAQQDHPYATRHGSPRLDPSTINVQSGDFRADWRALPIATLAGEIRIAVVNDSPVADFLRLGTRTMFARPLDREVELAAEPILERLLEEEIERVLRQTYS